MVVVVFGWSGLWVLLIVMVFLICRIILISGGKSWWRVILWFWLWIVLYFVSLLVLLVVRNGRISVLIM